MQLTDYTPQLDYASTQRAVTFTKRIFRDELADALNLLEIDAPPALPIGTGMQDDLAGTQSPVQFTPTATERTFQIVHSLAKWKRYQLARLDAEPGEGLVTLMRAIRKEETLSPIHSIYVDQWDWEQVIEPSDRSLDKLQQTVRSIYDVLLRTEAAVAEDFGLEPFLDDEITFVHALELAEMYPDLTPLDREKACVREHGSSFIIGIGHPLTNGEAHDLRAADYDDWSTMTSRGRGLNGDIIVWHPVLQDAIELSSMGIRVDADALKYQLDMLGQDDRIEKPFHQKLLAGELPQTMGGGIGQSRICMLLLQKAHIGEVQAGLWPEKLRQQMKEKGIPLI